ncbi:uncharacterized protein LOC124946046 [Impatiens glandulifera]|uniref:uncharacterized protein LOC124946046 n=1 Tax=Impatiens glandulifera TaxID=253017 RepID=UPI001FB0B252|nr:uncharacterized protein LOC124946046 [Impatiens glandulifera]
MKGPEAKVARMEDILNLPVQDPTSEEFSAADLDWVKVDGGRQGVDDIALIPYARVADFVKGESVNAECPASFRVESKRKRSKGSISKPRVDCCLEYTLYWCSYGPEDYRNSESGIADVTNIKPPSGKGSRPGRRHMLRGCMCHFTVKQLYNRPLIALIIFNQRDHVDKTGAPCHGLLDQDAVGTRAMYAPRISEELRMKVMSMLYVGMSLDNIMQHHMEEVQKHGGPINRDDFLTRNDVRNMERLTQGASHELDVNDESSIKMWVQRNQKNVFVFQEESESEPFILGIQSDWQLQQMIRYGRNNVIASHSGFGLKQQLKYPICSLLTFDSTRNPIPVAWIVAPHHALHCVQKWMVPLVERIRAKDSRWRPNAFFVDDPSFDVSIVRDSFQCCVLICLWHVRRACLKHILKSCSNVDLQREMFKHLGQVLYCTRNGENSFDSVEEFVHVFVDQSAFMDYFRTKWLNRIELWMNSIRVFPVASQDFYAAIEAYHQKLKFKISSHRQRIDWLIHIMTTEIHSLYWLDQYKMETENPGNSSLSLSTNSWYQAVQIPDTDVLLENDTNAHFAKVVSQTNKDVTYNILNPGSEFSLCDCDWARLGNVCKHLIKVAIICKDHQTANRPEVMLAQVYRRVLLELLQNVPDDPLVLDHAILNATRLQREIRGLEDLSNNGLHQGDGVIPEFRV